MQGETQEGTEVDEDSGTAGTETNVMEGSQRIKAILMGLNRCVE